jgi:hypothetical protein
MSCQRCKSNRVAAVYGKTSDCFSFVMHEIDYDGYVPKDIGIADEWGDGIEISYCLDCGQIQGKFPLPMTELESGSEIEDE